MDFLHAEIGAAKDNTNNPIHNWYKFTAGFSYKFVEGIISDSELRGDSCLFDPFAGCGTTLVSAQKLGIEAVGNEAQAFMYDVIRAKLNWRIDQEKYEEILYQAKEHVDRKWGDIQLSKAAHPLLHSLYSHENLRIICLIRDSLNDINAWKYQLFFRLSLSQTLHKVCIHPIAVLYIVRGKTLANTRTAWEVFEETSHKMFLDMKPYKHLKKTSRIYLQDSRHENPHIPSNSCHISITSPPYLNNLDYGEVSKVHTHFFGMTNDWGDITRNVRKKLVTGSTTHYKMSDFDLNSFQDNEFCQHNPKMFDTLLRKAYEIKTISKQRKGKKSFDILMFLYFNDMYSVLKEMRRVVETKGRVYMILGDSAPYSVYIPTTVLMGKIAMSVGFKHFKIHNIRFRGSKWKSLKYRHNRLLAENVLEIK